MRLCDKLQAGIVAMVRSSPDGIAGREMARRLAVSYATIGRATPALRAQGLIALAGDGPAQRFVTPDRVAAINAALERQRKEVRREQNLRAAAARSERIRREREAAGYPPVGQPIWQRVPVSVFHLGRLA